jgi:N-acetylmuramoyl-L-alanine amidase CwlA
LCPWFGLSKAQILEKCDENVNNEQSGEEGAGLKASATRTTSSSNNKRTGNDSCRCGGRDHKRITSKNCPWFGLSKAQILEKCAENDEKMKEKNNVESTLENLKCTATLVRVPTNDLEENVQSTGKL